MQFLKKYLVENELEFKFGSVKLANFKPANFKFDILAEIFRQFGGMAKNTPEKR